MNRVSRLRRSHRARWMGVGAVGVLLLGGAVVRSFTADAVTAPPKPVTVAADRGPVTVDVAASGTVEPAQNRSLGFTVTGTVETVPVQPGTLVKAGQVLATVDDAAAQAAVTQARTALTEARTALTGARTAAASPAPTPCGSSGQGTGRLAAYRPSAEPSASCPARAQAGSGPGGDAILTAEQRVNRATADLATARANLAGTTVTAPIAGTVLSVTGKVGSQVSRGATFVTLADTYAMQVSAKFPEADAGAIAVKQTATVTLADRDGQEFAATVVQVDPVGTSDGTMVTFGVVLAFTAAPKDLLVGQTAAVKVRTGNVGDALRVPSTAVHDVADGHGTVLLDAGATRRSVTVGLRGDRYTEVRSGLTPGEVVRRSW